MIKVNEVKEIDKLLEKLQEYKPNNLVFNQYSDKEPNGIIRLNNLKLYLESIDPEMILVGEAPGYHGCRWSGISFTSEYIMLKSGISIFERKDFKQSSEGSLKKERSATMVWDVIKEFSPLPLLWNIFPFHPYKSGKPEVNRPPTPNEVGDGEVFLKDLIKIYPKAKLIGVGNVSQEKLKCLGIECSPVRHPSMGGKKLFRKQMLKFKK